MPDDRPRSDPELLVAMLTLIMQRSDLPDDLRSQLILVRDRLSGLTSDDDIRTIRTMDIGPLQSERVRRAAGRATSEHPAQRRLYEKGVTLTDLAAELKEKRNRVASWFRAVDPRPIPERHRQYLKAKYGIPLGAWTRVQE